MKKIILSFSAMLICLTASAQNFTDDFESYAVGSYLGPQSAEWRTWSTSGDGTAEDTKVTDAMASSGTKSVYYSSTSSSGGPQDCVLDFMNTHTSGVFTFQADFYVNSGKTAYFNLQANATIGDLYALDVNMENGTILMQNGGAIKVSSSYPQATWFTLTVECNLTTKIWELKIDGVSAGKWLNATNSVRYADIYPVLNSQFYVDDVSYTHTPYTLTALNAAAADLNMGGSIATQVTIPKLTVVNAGTTTVTSFTATLNYNGNNFPVPVTGINLASLASTDVAFPNVTLAAGSNLAVATISNVNGGPDLVPSDNVTSIFVNPVLPALGKIVVGEEGTGTWCGWCPRGTVAMDRFAHDFSNLWAGVAVHNGDPMVVTEYDDGMNFSGFPSSKIDRIGAGIDPGSMSTPFLSRLQVAPTAFIEVGATYNATSRELKVSGEFDFQAAASNGYKAAFILTEDGVTGTTGYSQANYYSGGGSGPMGGFESLSNPVPAAQMVYHHVARDIKPSFGGFTGSFPATVAIGDVHAVNHTFTLPAAWNSDSLHIIVVLIAPNGQIDNAGKATITEAVANGFVLGANTSGGSGASVSEMEQIDATFALYPNPASTTVNMNFNLKEDSNVELNVLDMSGKVMASRVYGNMTGASTIHYDSSDLAQGIYTVEVTINGEKLTRRLVIQ